MTRASSTPGRWRRPLGVTGVALLAVAGTVLLSLEETREVVAGGEGPTAPAWTGFFPDYPGAQPMVPISDGLRVGGMTTRVGTHTTTDSPLEVQRFYAAVFRAEGLAVQVSEGAAQVLGVTAYDGERHHQRSITILPDEDGGRMPGAIDAVGSVVFVGLTPTGVVPEALPPLRMPVPPDARGVSDTAARDGKRITRTVTMVSQLEPEAAATVLLQRLEKAHFQGIQRPRSERAIVLRARAPWGEEVTYTVTGGPERPTAIVLVSRGLAKEARP